MSPIFLRHIGLAFVILAATTPLWVQAQTIDESNRSYYYDRVDADFDIKTNSTVVTTEKITFDFSGTYHSAWRDINLNKITAITDIIVLDGETLLPLKYSQKQLDKLDAKSWGYYTSWRENGKQNIEWYYNLSNTKHTWILRYTLHGAITFGREQDRFYWNVFTDYSEPVINASVTVHLPDSFTNEQIVAVAYTTPNHRLAGTYSADTRASQFTADNFAPQDDFTIDVGWPAGTVSQQAFWRDWLGFFWGYLAALIITLLTVSILALRWYLTEKKPIGRGTIIPQYEPPQMLKPAMAEIICKEQLSDSGLSATVIDLAIRGYIKIEEDFGNSWLEKMGGKHYKLIKQKDYQNDTELEDYEKLYLAILFNSKDIFSTREVKRWSNSRKQDLFISIQQLKKSILIDTEIDTNAFATKPTKETKAYVIGLFVVIAFIVLAISLLPAWNVKLMQYFIAGDSVIVASIIIWLFFRYEARLSEQGRILKEDWLGFKMYLETAERYRLQNLTPETFERFLPYAMIFGIEKKWANAFKNMALPPPNWYTGAAGLNAVGSGTAGNFSASAFSASFSSSFTSVFSNSGGGGGAGGGGAGGGGGGGGGGAG